MPCSSPRSSGWRATDWIIEPKILPMPMPAPRAPRPTPSARPIALPAFVTSPSTAAMRDETMFFVPPRWTIGSRRANTAARPSMLRLDRRADVDGGQGSKDEGLDPDHDHDLEDVEEDRGDDHGDQGDGLEDEDQAEEGQDQDVASQHVGEEPDAEGDQAHELAEDLERHDQREQRLRRLRDPALEVAHRPVPLDALVVGEHERQECESERDRDRARRGVDPPRRDAVVGLAGQWQRDEAEEVDDED